jgi:microcystin-dependent protein
MTTLIPPGRGQQIIENDVATLRFSAFLEGLSETVNGISEIVKAICPTGSIQMWGAAVTPSYWLLCDGSAVSRATYLDLFAVIGVTFGVGDGSTTFNLPDFRQKSPLGKADSGTGSTLGGSGGSIDHLHTTASHALTTAEMPVHLHSNGTLAVNGNHAHASGTLKVNGTHRHSHRGNDNRLASTTTGAYDLIGPYADYFWSSYAGDNVDVDGSTSDAGDGEDIDGSTSNSGSGGAHTHGDTGVNNHPFLAVNFIIKT